MILLWMANSTILSLFTLSKWLYLLLNALPCSPMYAALPLPKTKVYDPFPDAGAGPKKVSQRDSQRYA